MRRAIKHYVVPFVILTATGAPAWADHYGAIAYDRDSAHLGWSYDWGSEEEANSDALKRCGSHCDLVVEFHNTCAAMAVGHGKYVSWGANIDEDRAIAQAKGRCEANSSGCKVQVMVCNSPNQPSRGSSGFPSNQPSNAPSIVNPCMTNGGSRVPDCHR